MNPVSLVLLILVILLIVGAGPWWPHSGLGYGYWPAGGLGLVLLILVTLIIVGRL